MNDKNGVLLMRQVLNSRIEHIALQRNKLGFKTGSFILGELTRLKRTSLCACDLGYNPMSAALKRSIYKLISASQAAEAAGAFLETVKQ